MTIHRKPNWQKLRSQEMDWSVFHLRSRIIQAVRSFFISHSYLEVDPPYLTPYPTLDSNIHSMETRFNDEAGNGHPLFLHTSPEHAMKKLLAAGADRIFFLGKVFRDRERTLLHNPEFSMVEWYRTEATYRDIQNDAQELICTIAREVLSTQHLLYQGKKIDLTPPWDSINLSDLFDQKIGIDIKEAQTLESLKEAAASCNIRFQPDDDWDTLFFRLFLEKIEPELGHPTPSFVLDYPLRMGLMAKRKEDNPEWVERVELYIAGLELANGYSELLDTEEQKRRFEEEQKKKMTELHKLYPVDTELLSALETGIPPSAGMALGVDRLVMLFTDKKDIQDVLLFPLHQW